MTTAAVALNLGVSDPLSLLALSRTDYNTAVAILNAAQKMRQDYDQSLADYTAVKTANAILPGLTKAIGKMLRSLA